MSRRDGYVHIRTGWYVLFLMVEPLVQRAVTETRGVQRQRRR
jgi:hypothetical protein